jgi:cobalt-zinc-cadmium efflux system membrane fusion protein
MRLHALIMLALLCGGTLPLRAQQLIPLDAATLNRLGLVFMTVAAPDSSTGVRFPANVITSPRTESEVHALHGGVLESWQVQAGQQVATGEVLAIVRSAEVLSLQQDWVSAQASAQNATFALSRDQSLFDQGVIAQQRLQETTRQAGEARFRLQALQSALEQAGFSVQEQSVLQSDGRELGRYRIKAPLAGVVAHMDYRAGDMIDAGAAVVAVTGGTLWISAELPVALAARVSVGQTLRLADTSAALLVQQKEQALDARTQTVGVLAEFTEPVTLLPGQIVTLLLPPQPDGIVVPADAVVRNGADTVVFVKIAQGLESRVLTLQALGPDYLATSGLAAGDEVVVRGASIIKGITLGLGGE